MACIRYLARRRSSLVARTYHHQPSIAYIYHSNGDNKLSNSPPSLPGTKSFLPFPNSSKIGLFQYATKGSDFPVLPRFGASFYRHMSTANDDDLLSETVVSVSSSTTPEIVNEVAFAVDGSALPVAALQFLVDAVHSLTGFNWWVSIVLTTFIMRGALLPVEIIWWRQVPVNKELCKLCEKAMNARTQNKAVDPKIFLEVEKIGKGFSTRFLAGVLGISFPFIFYLAISNMAEKVPSFKIGGLYWFLDLSTPDSSLIFPLLYALTIWTRFQGSNKASRIGVVLAVISVPVTSFFPQAMFFYWIPSQLISITLSKARELPAVRLFLGLPQKPDADKNSG